MSNLFKYNCLNRYSDLPIQIYVNYFLSLHSFLTFQVYVTHPMPHESQQERRSSAERRTETFPFEATHRRSDMASAAATAYRQATKTNCQYKHPVFNNNIILDPFLLASVL